MNRNSPLFTLAAIYARPEHTNPRQNPRHPRQTRTRSYRKGQYLPRRQENRRNPPRTRRKQRRIQRKNRPAAHGRLRSEDRSPRLSRKPDARKGGVLRPAPPRRRACTVRCRRTNTKTNSLQRRRRFLPRRKRIGTDRTPENAQRRKGYAKRYGTVAELFLVCSRRAIAYNRMDTQETGRDALRIAAFVKRVALWTPILILSHYISYRRSPDAVID